MPRRTSRTRATTSGACCTTPASRRGSSTRRSSSRCSSSGSASRTPRPDDARLRRPAQGRLRSASGSSGSRSSSTRSRSRSSARRPTAASSTSGRSSARSGARSARRRSTCCPRRRPRTQPSRTTSGCTGSARCSEWLEPDSREAVRALLVDADDRVLLVRTGTGDEATWWGTRAAGSRRARNTRRRCGASCARKLGLEEFELGPLLSEHRHVFPWARRLVDQHSSVYVVARRSARAAADDRPRARGCRRGTAGGRSPRSASTDERLRTLRRAAGRVPPGR